MLALRTPWLALVLAILVLGGDSTPDSGRRHGFSKGQLQATIATLRSQYGSDYQTQISTLCQKLLQTNGTQSSGGSTGSDHSDDSNHDGGRDDDDTGGVGSFVAGLLAARAAGDERSCGQKREMAEDEWLERRQKRLAASRHTKGRNDRNPHSNRPKVAGEKSAAGKINKPALPTFASDGTTGAVKPLDLGSNAGAPTPNTETGGTSGGTSDTGATPATGAAPDAGTSPAPATGSPPDAGTAPSTSTPPDTAPPVDATPGAGDPGTGPSFALPPFLRDMDGRIVKAVCRVFVNSTQLGDMPPKTDDDDEPRRPWWAAHSDRGSSHRDRRAHGSNTSTNGSQWEPKKKHWTWATTTVTVTVTETATVAPTSTAAATT